MPIAFTGGRKPSVINDVLGLERGRLQGDGTQALLDFWFLSTRGEDGAHLGEDSKHGEGVVPKPSARGIIEPETAVGADKVKVRVLSGD